MKRLWLCCLAAALPVLSTARGAVENFKVVTDSSVDTTSLESIVRDVFARSGARGNDEKAIALYDWLHQAIFHWAYPTEAAPQSVGPLKVLNVYGWGLCGGQHTVLKALYETAGWECRYVGWSNPGHTTIEVKYDGRWHYFDVFLKCYFWSKDKSHVVGQEEIAADPSLVLDAVKEGRAARSHLCCGDTPEGIISGVKSRKVAGDSKGWASVAWRDQGYSPNLRLPCGSTLRLEWAAETNGFAVSGKAPRHSCGTKDYRHDPVLGPLFEHYGPRGWANGRFLYAPDFSQPADVADVELAGAAAGGGKLAATAGQGAALFKLPLPYAWVTARLEAGFEGGDGRLQLSNDGGKTWKACAPGDISTLVKQKYDVWIKVEFAGALTKFRVEAMVEHNRGVQPYLVAGKNRVTVTGNRGSLPAGAVVSVTVGYQEATVANPAKRQRWDGTGITYGPEKTARGNLTAASASFDVETGGNTAPKMLFLERCVRAKP